MAGVGETPEIPNSASMFGPYENAESVWLRLRLKLHTRLLMNVRLNVCRQVRD